MFLPSVYWMNVLFVVGLLACPFAAVFIQRRFLRADVIDEAERLLHAEPDEIA